jgi:hypothetical protein
MSRKPAAILSITRIHTIDKCRLEVPPSRHINANGVFIKGPCPAHAKKAPEKGALGCLWQWCYHQLLFLRRGARYRRAFGRYVRRTRFGLPRRRPPPPLIPTPNENDMRILGSSFLCRYKWSQDSPEHRRSTRAATLLRGRP